MARTAEEKIGVSGGMVGGKIPVDEYESILRDAVKNPTSDTLTLGKYETDITSYTIRAGDTTFFDMGSNWNLAKERFDLTDKELFSYFNKPILEDAVSSGKIIRFSHNPLDHRTGSLVLEWDYIKTALKVSDTDIFFEGGFWYVK